MGTLTVPITSVNQFKGSKFFTAVPSSTFRLFLFSHGQYLSVGANRPYAKWQLECKGSGTSCSQKWWQTSLCKQTNSINIVCSLSLLTDDGQLGVMSVGRP